MVFHLSFSDNKSPQVSRTLLSILADLNNDVVWVVSTRPLISESSSHFTTPLWTVPRAPMTIGITVTFTFHRFFNSLARSWYLSFLLLSFNFTQWSARTKKSTIWQVLFLSLLLLGLVIWLRLGDPFVSQNLRSLCVSFSRIQNGSWKYHLFVWSNLYFLHSSQWITFPTHSCLILYSFCASLLHSFNM